MNTQERKRSKEVDDSFTYLNQEGRVIHVKDTYGFIKPDNTGIDDVIFFQVDVEPWRKGFKKLTGPVGEFRGERVRFDIRKTGRVVKGREGLQAVNIDVIEGK